MTGQTKTDVTVIGAGLAGCEAAYQLAKRGIKVRLYEMRPAKTTPAHHTENFAELVCSNSLRSNELSNAVGLLKEEMRRLDSLIMRCADETQVPAGGALAVDREGFSKLVTKRIKEQENIEIIPKEVHEISRNEPVIVASGPLTEGALYEEICSLVHDSCLHFFDAAAPIVTKESIDFSKAFFGSRYGKGEADYINCPMNQAQYEAFYEALVSAEIVALHGFENKRVFEGCMPVEVMAKRGVDTLLFGPLKPVGLMPPGSDERPYAVVQLRRDNAAGSLYNLVGFQTNLKFGEQKRVFSLIPGLEQAEFVRYGVMHRNTFLNSPQLLDCFYRLKEHENIMFAGQITGVEGYIESASSGLLCGLNMARQILGKELLDFTNQTAIGALAHYISDSSIVKFQPMNINFGIIEPLGERIKGKKEKNEAVSRRALAKLEEFEV